MKIRSIFVLGLLLILSWLTPFSVIYANVPTVLSLEEARRGDDDVLIIEVSHGSPSSSHYIDSIEVEVDGEVFTIEDLGEQSGTVFTVEHILESSGTGIRVRAHCNLHGWSQWTQLGEDTTDQGRDIPGFSYAALFIGLMVSFLFARIRTHN